VVTDAGATKVTSVVTEPYGRVKNAVFDGELEGYSFFLSVFLSSFFFFFFLFFFIYLFI